MLTLSNMATPDKTQLDPALADVLRRAVADAMTTTLSPVVEIDEAVRLTQTQSKDAFWRWARRWGVKGKAGGRYSRAIIMRALEREAQDLNRLAEGRARRSQARA